MKRTITALFAALLPLTSNAADDRPNVVLIYGDDVGWGDIGVQGSVKNPTPHLDKLAGQSLRFTDGHCTAATCTPSRYSMLSGIHGFRDDIRILAPNAPLTIPPDNLTLPDIFKKAGYQTAIVGKWHLGLGAKGKPVDWNGNVKPGPLELGFDYSFLLPSTNDRVPCVYLVNHRVLNLDPADPLFVGNKKPDVECTVYPNGRQTPEAMTYYRSTHGHNQSVINGIGRIGVQWGGKAALWNDETMTDTFVEKSGEWIRQRDKSKPFFLFYSAQDIHVPRAPHPRFQGKSKTGYRGDAMIQFDWAVGELMKVIEEQGIADDTIVIFSSDNGPVYDDGYDDGTVVKTSTKEVDQGHDGSGPYRGGKYQIYEGGTRVPFLVRWPGRIKPGVSDGLVSQIDFLASFASMFGQEIPAKQAIDSRSTLATFLGEDKAGLPYMVEEARKTVALREGSWKFVLAGKPAKDELYNLAEDVGEATNVAKKFPRRAGEMRRKFIEIRDAEGGIRSLKGL